MTEASHAARVHARTDRFLLAIARGQGETALGLNPFVWRGTRTADGRPQVVIVLRNDGGEITVTGEGDTALDAVRAAVLQVPALAVRLAKIEAVVADSGAASDRPEVPRLTQFMVEYCESLCRMKLRKKEESIAKFKPRPDQPVAEAEAALDQLRRKEAFIRETLRALRSTRDGIMRGRRINDSIQHTAELDTLDLGELPFQEEAPKDAEDKAR